VAGEEGNGMPDEKSGVFRALLLKPATVLVVVILLGIGSYSNSFRAGFHFDDIRLIRFNFTLRDLSAWKEILLSERQRPLLIASFALNYRFSAHNPAGYHAVNLALHLIAVVLFYLLLLRRSSNPFIPALAAAFMVCHPLNTESVTYISSRSILLCAVFYLTGLLLFESYLRTEQKRYVAAFWISFIAGILSKEEAILLVPAVLIANLVFCGWESVKKHRWFHGTSVIIVLAVSILRIMVYSHEKNAFPFPLDVWIPTQLSVWLRYMGLMVYPVHLNVDPDILPVNFTSPLFWISVVIVTGIVCLCVKYRAAHPFVSFWGLLTVLGFQASSWVPLQDFMAEHRVYLSVFGFCSVIAYALVTLVRRQIAIVLAILILSFYFITTLQRNYVWQNEFTLWYDAVQKSPQKIRPHLNLASAYTKQKAYDLAIQEYLLARRLNPDSPFAYSGLGLCYLWKGNQDLAEKNFRKALEIHPDHVDAKTGLGMTLYRLGRYSEAIPYLQGVVSFRKESSLLMEVLADSLIRTANGTEAIVPLERGIDLDPDNSRWYPLLIEAYFQTGNYDKTAEVYFRYRDRISNDPQTRQRISEILKAAGYPDESRRMMTFENVE